MKEDKNMYSKVVKKVILLSDLSPGGVENAVVELEIFLNTSRAPELIETIHLSDESTVLIFEHVVPYEEE